MCHIRTANAAVSICLYIIALQLGNLTVYCLSLKLYFTTRKMFLSPRRESNPQPSDLR